MAVREEVPAVQVVVSGPTEAMVGMPDVGEVREEEVVVIRGAVEEVVEVEEAVTLEAVNGL